MFGTPQFTVKAAVDADGNASAKVSVRVPYGERGATVARDITDTATLEKIGSALSKLISKELRDELNQEGFAAASEAFTVAHKKGETV